MVAAGPVAMGVAGASDAALLGAAGSDGPAVGALVATAAVADADEGTAVAPALGVGGGGVEPQAATRAHRTTDDAALRAPVREARLTGRSLGRAASD
jgi:hypothetical protein